MASSRPTTARRAPRLRPCSNRAPPTSLSCHTHLGHELLSVPPQAPRGALHAPGPPLPCPSPFPSEPGGAGLQAGGPGPGPHTARPLPAPQALCPPHSLVRAWGRGLPGGSPSSASAGPGGAISGPLPTPHPPPSASRPPEAPSCRRLSAAPWRWAGRLWALPVVQPSEQAQSSSASNLGWLGWRARHPALTPPHLHLTSVPFPSPHPSPGARGRGPSAKEALGAPTSGLWSVCVCARAQNFLLFPKLE